MARESATTSELTIDVPCTPRNRANLRRLKTNSIQSFQRWEKENELLYAMIEDESAWLSRLFPDAFVTPELFFYALEDGTILCLLANFIQEMAGKYGARTGKSIPGKKFTFHKSKKGKRQSKLFLSRENVDKFLTWCRWHGIPEAILFESNDAVMVDECRTGGREIVICLMEIARRSSQYEIEEVPQLIKLEREIEAEELSDVQRSAEEQQGLVVALDTSNISTGSRGDRSPIDSDSGVESVFEEGDQTSPRLSEFAADEISQETTKVAPESQTINKFEGDDKPQKVMQKSKTNSLLDSSQPKTELDKKVCKIAQEYNIKIVHRLKEGKYIIMGKTMFVRMLNDHLLVRIGGGWDTLDHYVMTHVPKFTGPEGIKSRTPSSSERKSSGVWSKFVDKVKRRESQPNITDSPVVISKRERPDSSPSVYRLRDRVKKKLSVTEKDEKDISAAIRNIETNLTETEKSTRSPYFTSKTFFQLKSRFDKGRKGSRENLFEKKEDYKMAEQNGEMIASEQRIGEETKQEEIGTTLLFESEIQSEPKTTEASHGFTEEFSSSTTTVMSEFSSNEFQFDSGKDDFPVNITSTETNFEENRPSGEDFLLFNQQTQQSEVQSFPNTNTDDLFSNDNPPLFLSEALQPEQKRDEEQVHKDEGEEESGFEILTAAHQPNIEEQLENHHHEPPVGDQADSFLEIDSEPIKVSPESEEVESSPFVWLPQEIAQPEVNQAEQPQHLDEAAEMPMEHIEDIPHEPEPRDNELPAQIPCDYAAASDIQVDTSTDPREEEHLEDIHPEQMTRNDIESSGTAMDEYEHVVSEEDVPETIKIDPSVEEHGGAEEREPLPPRVDESAQEEQIEDMESSGSTMKDVEHVASEEYDREKDADVPETIKMEETEERELLPQRVDESAQDTNVEPETLPEISSVVESENTFDTQDSLVNILDVEEPRADAEVIPPALPPQIDDLKEEQDKTEKKGMKNVPLSASPANHKKPTKKTPGTTKKEHDKAANTSTSKNLNGSKKDEHKAERPKSSTTKPSSTRTTKTTSATTVHKTRAVPAAGSTAATKRPASALAHKPGSATSKPATQKPSTNVTSKSTTKTTTRPSESRKPPGSTNARPTSAVKDKKPHPPSSATQKSESLKAKPRVAVSTRTTDKTDGKVETTSRPPSAKTKPLSGTTRTTVKKTTSTTTKSTSGPTSKSEVSKTNTTTNKGGITSSSTTTVKKTTEPSGKTKASKETTSHQKPPARNKTSEVKSGTHGKPGSASLKAKPTSATTRGKPASAMATGKPNSTRPKSPTKGATKKTAVSKDETTVSGATVQETPASELPAMSPLSDITTPQITAESKDYDTRVIQHTEMIEDDGETKIVHTKEVTEMVFENGEQQLVTTETVLEESCA